jgi:hypothetical protein
MRIRTILAAAAVPAALAASLLGTAGAASAATNVTHISDQATAEQLMAANGGVFGPVDIPAGADIQLRWVDVHGPLTVEGKLSLQASTIEGNTTVTGPGAGLSLFNDPGNTFWGNVTVDHAGGYYDGRDWINTGLGFYSNGQQINGGLTFTNNTGSMIAPSGSLTVNGKFTYSGNRLPYTGGITVLGKSVIS